MLSADSFGRRVLHLASGLALVFAATSARAQQAPLGGHYGGRATDTGFASQVNATGGYSTSVPLDFPATRDGLGIPLSITSGGHVVGAAGVGWDIPLSYVRYETSIAKRKPADAPDGAVQGREHVVLSIGGMTLELVRKGNQWVARQDSSSFSAAQQGTSWVVTDGHGHTYFFAEPVEALGLGLALLKTVSDSTVASATPQMTLTHEVRNLGTAEAPAYAIDLTSIAYNAHPNQGCAKDEIDLAYGPSQGFLATSTTNGQLYVRDRTIALISVERRSSCVSATNVRSYGFDFAPDVDTRQPRLQDVHVAGRAGTAEGGTPITVATYHYNNVTNVAGLTYSTVSSTPVPSGADPSQISSTFISSTSGGRTWYSTPQSLTDVTGDGVPEMIYAVGGVLWSARGIPNVGGGMAFGVPALLGDTTLKISDSLEGRSVNHLSQGDDPFDREDIWKQAIDVNGDGRIDIVDADAHPNQWTVYLNMPSAGPSGVMWVERGISTQKLIDYVTSKGHHLDVSTNLPLSRRYSGTMFTSDYNGDPIENDGSTTFTEWTLRDINGDGYPDFVLNTKPAYYFDSAILDYSGETKHYPVLPADNQVEVMFDVGGMTLDPSPGAVTRMFSDAALLVNNTSCGIEEWTPNLVQGAASTLVCTFADVTGDGIPERIEDTNALIGTGIGFSTTGSIKLPALAGVFYSSIWNQCGSNSPSDFRSHVENTIRDVTGDGLPDFVANGRIYIGTGTGFTAGMDAHGLALSENLDNCAGNSRTISGLFDIDGDGRPEVLSADASGHYRVDAPTIGGQALSVGVGQIAEIDNAYGAAIVIGYRSAKEDLTTPHQVPFPEVVVGSVTSTLVSQPSNTMRTLYAYGNAAMSYNGNVETFDFPGYGRTVALEAAASQNGAKAVGQATITDTYALPDFVNGSSAADRFARYQLVGKTSALTNLVGTLGDNPGALLAVNVVTDTRVNATTSYEYRSRLFEEPAATGEAIQDCMDFVYPYDYSASLANGFSGYDTCSAHGFSYTSKTRSVRGSQATNDNVATASEVLAIDDFARPTQLMYENDVVRGDDDVCVDLTYANAAGASPVLDATATQKVWGCAKAPYTISFESYQYDGYPIGTVTAGLLTSTTSERHTTDDGNLIASIHMFDASYDAVGNVDTVMAVRDDGAVRQTHYTYDAFGLAPVTTQVASSSLTNIVTATTYDPVTLLPLSTTDANGTARGATYDGFGRILTSTITPPGGAVGVLAVTSYVGFADDSGRRVLTTTFDDAVDPALLGTSKGHATTTYLDEVGRSRRTESSLGDDYAGATMVSYRTFDPFGRVAFASDPFASTDDPVAAFGASNYFNDDGTPKCSVHAKGPHAYTAVTNVASDVYTSCWYHGYSNHLETSGFSAPDANDPTSAQAGVLRLTTTTAIGRRVSQSTSQGGTTLEYSTYGEDRLGNLTSMTRYRTPSGPSFPVTTSWRYDSFGQRVAEQDPESALQSTTYDAWGEPTATQWTDGSTDRRMVTQYDALGRVTHREEQNGGATDHTAVYDYMYDTPFTVSSEVSPTYVLGRLAKAIGPQSTIYFSYDTYGAINARTDVDNAGNRYVAKSMQSANGLLRGLDLFVSDTGYQNEHVDYAYDSAARQRGVYYKGPTSSASLFSADSIDLYGNVRSAIFGNGTTFKADYASSGRRLLLETAVLSTAGSRHYEYGSYDAAGRQLETSEVNAVGTVSRANSYDALGRLTQANAAGAESSKWSYTYDALGNITKSGDQLSTTAGIGLSYNTVDEDRICKITYQGSGAGTNCNVVHDVVGNITSEGLRKGQRTLSYYDAGKIKAISDLNGRAELTYDPFGNVQQMIVRARGEAREDHHYGNFFEVRNDQDSGVTSTFIQRNIPGAAGLTASLRGASDNWVFAFGDQRGMRVTTDIKGNFLQDVAYHPFGQTTSTGTVRSSSLYSTDQWNGGDSLAAFDLVHVGARLYDPVIGRFLSRDPITLTGTATSANPYSFAENDPINMSDPSGMCPPEQACGDENKGTGGSDTPPAWSRNANGNLVPTQIIAHFAPLTSAPTSSSAPSSAADGMWPQFRKRSLPGKILDTWVNIGDHIAGGVDATNRFVDRNSNGIVLGVLAGAATLFPPAEIPVMGLAGGTFLATDGPVSTTFEAAPVSVENMVAAVDNASPYPNNVNEAIARATAAGSPCNNTSCYADSQAISSSFGGTYAQAPVTPYVGINFYAPAPEFGNRYWTFSSTTASITANLENEAHGSQAIVLGVRGIQNNVPMPGHAFVGLNINGVVDFFDSSGIADPTGGAAPWSFNHFFYITISSKP